MQNKIVALSDAVADIPSGSTIFVSGFGGSGIPERLLAALYESSAASDLTLVNNNAGAGNPSFLKLVETGRVARIVCSYPRMPGSDSIRRMVEAKALVVDVMPQGTLVERIRAAGAGLGPFFTPTGYGTFFANGKETRIVNGRGYVLEQPLFADYAFVKAAVADTIGNLTFRYAQRNFGPVMCTAAKTTLVEVDTVVEVGQIDPCHVVTPGIFVNRLIKVTEC
jgi:3-oxoadipate CoA-transferase alpha subunit